MQVSIKEVQKAFSDNAKILVSFLDYKESKISFQLTNEIELHLIRQSPEDYWIYLKYIPTGQELFISYSSQYQPGIRDYCRVSGVLEEVCDYIWIFFKEKFEKDHEFESELIEVISQTQTVFKVPEKLTAKDYERVIKAGRVLFRSGEIYSSFKVSITPFEVHLDIQD